ncbi:MAG: hypothetical protein JNK26_03935 [Candidatus Doudnabacteria bacterium]|nr:hypothetical protein [Candidatus Doudnabacteria bacterium]
MKPTNSVVENNLLDLEFGYIQMTINQTIEDRYRVLNFYIGIAATVASVLVGVISLQPESVNSTAKLGIGMLSGIMWLVGVIFTLMLIRLRQAWYSAVTSLNQLKSYMIAHSVTGIETAIRWQNDRLPAQNKLWSIHFYAALLVAIISSIFLAVIAIIGLSDTMSLGLRTVIALVLSTANVLGQVGLYYWMLRG